mgnify:CR=1 FL=1
MIELDVVLTISRISKHELYQFAYLDPSILTYVISLIIGLFVGFTYYAKAFYYKIKNMIKNLVRVIKKDKTHED